MRESDIREYISHIYSMPFYNLVNTLVMLYVFTASWLPSKPKITLANLAKVDKFLLAK